MESRNVKIIDEHGIDRNANVICSLGLDGKDYVLYSIERDGDNDNLFVSKIINNIDGTSSMVNIEDSMEKSKINDVVKELITYSVKNEADKTTGSVVLDNGTNVTISSVLFNKEQNINVSKTYITTIKKSVTKVSEDFYKVDEVKKEENEPVFENVLEEAVTPVVEENIQKIDESLENQEKLVQEPVLETPFLEMPPLEAPEVTETEEVVESNEEEKLQETLVEPVSAQEEVKPVIPVIPVETAIPQVEPDHEAVKPILPVEPVQEEVKKEEPPVVLGSSSVELPKVEEEVQEKVEPTVIPVAPIPSVLPTEVSQPVETVQASSQEEPKIFFDGSNETNLNMAFKDEGVQSLREFGMDKVNETSLQNDSVQENVKTLKRSKGFANNKFFMVIAIIFFIAACVFLGYEAFQYFQLTK